MATGRDIPPSRVHRSPDDRQVSGPAVIAFDGIALRLAHVHRTLVVDMTTRRLTHPREAAMYGFGAPRRSRSRGDLPGRGRVSVPKRLGSAPTRYGDLQEGRDSVAGMERIARPVVYCGSAYRPLQMGARCSTNALGPSSASSLRYTDSYIASA
jgi:hypothetical protein